MKREKGEIPADLPKIKENEEVIILRTLNMQDLKEAKSQVSPSFYLTMWNLKIICSTQNLQT
jgi:hypothetical protein